MKNKGIPLQPADDNYRRSAFRLVDDQTDWHRALKSLKDPHPLQSWIWGDLKNRWGWTSKPLRLDVRDDYQSLPPLAVALVLKRRVSHLPFSILYVPKGPILDYSDGALRRVVLSQLEQFAMRERSIFIKIDPEVLYGWDADEVRKSPSGLKYVAELKDRGWKFSADQIQFQNTVELDLNRSEDELLASMKQKTRYNIRLAKRKGITIRKGTSHDFPLIANMYMVTANRDDFAVRPEKYYLDAWNGFFNAGMAQPFIAEFKGEPIAAIIIIHMGKRAIYMYGASTNKERKRMPNYLLQWEAIRWAQEQGYEIYDFWGAPNVFSEEDPLWGVWRFKSGFRGQVVRHIGAWDYPVKPFWYWVYTIVIPRYLDFLRSRNS